MDLFSKFTTHGKNALKNAFSLALAYGHRSITPAHILYGLSQQRGSIAAQILTKSKIQGFEIKKYLIGKTTQRQNISQIGISTSAKKILERSFLIAHKRRHSYVGTEHLLLSLLSISDNSTQPFIGRPSDAFTELNKQVETILQSTSKFPHLKNRLSQGSELPDDGVMFGNLPNTGKASLEQFAVELTSKKVSDQIDPVIGRESEIERLIQILARRTKNNPMLLGEPGVGKTAIVEGLAKKIVAGDVPEVLFGKKIYALDLGLLVAGTSFRGEFENRIKQLVAQVKADDSIILFIDEIHNMIGAGSATGSMDAANILKPALARGYLRCIGATTHTDYKKFIENDPALERRFQTIIVEQPDSEKTIEILRGIKTNYEIFHHVTITDQAIEAATELSERYITDRFLPDKAIDLIDEAASSSKIKGLSSPRSRRIFNLERELKEVIEKKLLSVQTEKFKQAVVLREAEKKLRSELVKEKNKQEKNTDKFSVEINRSDIAKIVSRHTGIPLNDLVSEEKKRLQNLGKLLSKDIINQTEAVEAVAEHIKRSKSGVSDSGRPIGTFMFLGPSGVGKTELARKIAQIIFGSSSALVKIDMSEFSESFTVSKLIGAPAGYVGYKEGAKLTDPIKQRPYAVVLLDEIEKAHPSIFNLLLQIFEDGQITDAGGRKINFRNTVVIMTSNLGAEFFSGNLIGFDSAATPGQKLEQNFESISNEVRKKVKNSFPPELLSRLDKMVVFKPLGQNDLIQIAKLQLKELKNRLAKKGIELRYDPTVAKTLAQKSYNPSSGAREIRKNIQEIIESQLADVLLSDDTPRQIHLKSKNSKIHI